MRGVSWAYSALATLVTVRIPELQNRALQKHINPHISIISRLPISKAKTLMRVPVAPEEEAEAEASMQSTRPFSVLTEMSPVPTHAPEAVATATPTSKHPKKEWQIPKLLFKCKDVTHPGAAIYFAHSNTATLLRDAVVGVLESLYTYDTTPNTYLCPHLPSL